LPIQQTLVTEFPAIADYRRDLALNRLALAESCAQMGQLTAAEEALREALLHYEQLPKNYPLAAYHRTAFIQTRCLLAQMCQMPDKKRYAASLCFYREAFAEMPKLADDLKAQHRYNAACAAALAGCGQGKDADKVDSKERARLRQQALDWLRADLKAYRQVLEKLAGKADPVIAQRIQHWLQDEDFAGVRGAEALGKLPEAERKEWQKLWQEVEALRQRAAEGPTKASSARP
jgi:hypothetical protein